MGRPPQPIGTMGKIWTKEDRPGYYRAGCRYRDFDGQTYQVTRSGSTADKAVNRLKEAIRDWVAPVTVGALSGDSKFTDAIRSWLRELESDAEQQFKSWGTIDTYTHRADTIIIPAVGNLRITEVDNPRIGTPAFDRLCRQVRDTSSVSSAKTVRAVLSGACDYLVRQGFLTTNPVRGIGRIESKKARVQRKKPRALTADQLIDLFDKLDNDAEACAADLPDLARLFAATGERTGEALAASWPDFDEHKKKLTMSGNVIRAKGRGKIINSGKTTNAGRDIALAGWCVRMLVARRSVAVDPMGLIFPSSTGTVREASNVRNRAWRPFAQRAGYEWVTFRTLRKTVATLLDEAGLTARQIADILGHANPSMTQDVYMGRGEVSRLGADALEARLASPDA